MCLLSVCVSHMMCVCVCVCVQRDRDRERDRERETERERQRDRWVCVGVYTGVYVGAAIVVFVLPLRRADFSLSPAVDLTIALGALIALLRAYKCTIISMCPP